MMAGWVDGWTDGQVSGWMNEQMKDGQGKWMHVCIDD